MKKYINRLLVGLNLILWLTFHLVYEQYIVTIRNDTLLIFFGIIVHVWIIDLVLWIGVIINLILLLVIE